MILFMTWHGLGVYGVHLISSFNSTASLQPPANGVRALFQHYILILALQRIHRPSRQARQGKAKKAVRPGLYRINILILIGF